MENEGIKNDITYAIISNIPSEYHSSDLRNYFSQFIESGGFECFHFRHRPEQKLLSSDDSVSMVSGTAKNLETKVKRSCCCVVRVKKKRIHDFFKMYNRKHWNDRKGEIMTQVCYIARVKPPHEANTDVEPKHHTRRETKTIPADREDFTMSDFQSLPELHPPDLMPNGNVGTPTMVFMDYIKQCRLPPSIIKKLGLSFPRTRTTKMYGSVPLDYDGDVVPGGTESDVCVTTATGHDIVSAEDVNTAEVVKKDSEADVISGSEDSSKGKRKTKSKGGKDAETKRRMQLNIEEKMIGGHDSSDEDNDSCEEWERHEALYDDPSNQERNKERLFEEEIELKWEKGGSGLVFYTDAQYWQAQEGDFDEQTADDWDVDMSGYYEEGAGDKDARDYLTMRQDKRRRDGIEATDRFSAGIGKKLGKKMKADVREKETKGSGIGKFEAHTRGFGRKIMEGQGWTEGQGLGSTIRGMSDALENEGQRPADRRGFGYRGEKLVRHVGPAKRKVIISTVYDNPEHTDPNEPLHRRNKPYHLKYRDEILFQKSEEKPIVAIDNLSGPS